MSLALSALSTMYSTAFQVTTTVVTTTVSEVARNFFQHLLLHPGEHLYAIIAFSAIGGGAILGSVFLLKKGYEKYFPLKNS